MKQEKNTDTNLSAIALSNLKEMETIRLEKSIAGNEDRIIGDDDDGEKYDIFIDDDINTKTKMIQKMNATSENLSSPTAVNELEGMENIQLQTPSLGNANKFAKQLSLKKAWAYFKHFTLPRYKHKDEPQVAKT